MRTMRYALITILAFLFSASAVYGASNLYEFYNGNLPTIEERAFIYEGYGFDGEYRGTAEQNQNLLYALEESDGMVAPLFGATNPVPETVAFFETSLQASISSSATSFTLLKNTDAAGSTLASSTYAFVIDEGTASEETVIADCFPAGAKTCDAAIRGVSPINGTSTVSALQKAHRRGASVKITNAPFALIHNKIVLGEEFLPAVLRYRSGTACTAGSSSSALCDKAYVDNLVVQGAATSTETVGGIVELATLSEQETSADLGANQPTVLQSKNATSTCQVVNTYVLVASSTTGKLDGNCLDTTAAQTWSGANTFTAEMLVNASSTENGTTTAARSLIVPTGANVQLGNSVLYTDALGATFASSTSLQTDANGNLSFGSFRGTLHATGTTNVYLVSNSTLTIEQISVAGGTLGTKNAIHVYVQTSDYTIKAGATMSVQLDYGGTNVCTASFNNSTGGDLADAKSSFDFYLFNDGATNSQKSVCRAVSGDNSDIGGTKDVSITNGTGSASIDSTATQNLTVEAVGNSIGNTMTTVGVIIVVE